MTSPPPVLILSRGDVQALMDRSGYLEAVEDGFRAAATGKGYSPPPMAIEASGGTFHAKAASLQLDRNYVALKLNGNFPANPAARGLPTIQGAILLADGESGCLLAILDSIEITLRRTAAATALAARYLARPDSRTILLCGCGGQASAQLEALADLFPLVHGYAWDQDRERAAIFAGSARIPVEPLGDLRDAARSADIIVTCTSAREPFLGPQHVGPGTFIAAVGADSPDKQEVHPAVLAEALLVTDVTSQCEAMGEVHHALDSGAIGHGDIHAELAELVSGAKPGRTRNDQIALFDSTGTALQDVAAAAGIYRRAIRDPSRRHIALAD